MLNLDWERIFSGQTLSKGYRYYKTGRVEVYNDVREQTVYADVHGTDIYDTEIDYSNFPRLGMRCDCPYAIDGNYCKHMAAVLYSMEEDKSDYEHIAMSGSKAGTFGNVTSDNNNSGTKITPIGNTTANSSRNTLVPQQQNVSSKDKIIFPFESTKSGEAVEEYQYFDFAELTKNLRITESMYNSAMALLKSGRVDPKTEIRYYSSGMLDNDSAILQAQMKISKNTEEMEFENKKNRNRHYRYSYYDVSPNFFASVKMNRDTISELVCNCDACRNKRGLMTGYYYYNRIDKVLCEHLVALLKVVNEYILENHPGDATDYSVLQMMKGLRSDIAFQDDEAGEETKPEEKKTVTLVPLLQTDYHGIEACFKIGNDKMYQLKNMSELVDKVESRQVMELGKNQSIDFARETFKDDFSTKLYEMIQASVNEERVRYELSRMGSMNGTDKNLLLLIGRNLDAFFDICNGKTVEKKKWDGGPMSLKFTVDNPRLKLSLNPIYAEDKSFMGVNLQGKTPSIKKGAAYSYYFDEEKICRITPECANIMKNLTSAHSNVIDMKIGRKYLNKFFHNVLPVISKIADIKNNCEGIADAYMLPEASFVFFIDTESGAPDCRIKSVYGEKEFDAVEALAYHAASSGIRDLEKEREVFTVAKKYFKEYDSEKKLLLCTDEESVFSLLDEGLTELMRIGEVNLSDAFKRLKIRRRPKINIGVSVKSDLLELSVASEDISREELLEYLNSYKKKKKFFRLKNGDLMKVEEEDIGDISAMMDALHLSPKEFTKGNMKLPLYRALYLDKMLEQNSGIYAERDKTFKNLVKDFKTVNESDFETPEELEKVLRNYQTFGFKWLKTVESCHFGGILADDMGLGKTLQVISLLVDAKHRKKEAAISKELDVTGENATLNGTVASEAATALNGIYVSVGTTVSDVSGDDTQCTALVVSPASLVYNWKAEFERFAPALKVCTVTGTQSERADIISHASDWDVLVTSYDLLKRDIAEYADIEFDYEIIDEAQFIKNHSTAAAKSVKVVRSRQRFALTGTPIENRLSELWSIFDYLMPGFLYGYDVFKKEFETPIAKNKDENTMEQLKRMVAPFILRRLKKDVLKDIPDKLEEVYYAKMADKQRKVYDGEVVKIKKMLEKETDEAFGKKKVELLAELTRIRQICCDPHLLFEDYEGDSAKKDTCLDLIKSALEGEHRVLLFSQFTSMLDILQQELDAEDIGCYRIDGSTPKEKRIELVNAFNEGKDNVNVFLISLKAGGTGLNLTGADVVIHFDPWWNVAAQNQATDRAHRIGQTKVVSVYKIIAKDTIEEKILKMQEDKKNLAENILSGETGGLVGMSREDVMALLG